MRRLLIILLVLALLLPVMASAAPAGQSCGPGVVHVVAWGETVFRISLRYGTTVSAIVQANALANPNVIYAGQRLLVPCASGVTPPVVPTWPSGLPTPIYLVVPTPEPVQVVIPSNGGAIVPPQPWAVDCFNFRPTSPLDGFGHGTTTFYWDAAYGAQSYRVSIFNLDRGGLRAVYPTSGPFTSVRGDTTISALGEGFRFAWFVEAIVDGRAVCQTRWAYVMRGGEASAPAAAPTVAPTLAPAA